MKWLNEQPKVCSRCGGSKGILPKGQADLEPDYLCDDCLAELEMKL